ncbi:MAG: type IV pilin protein [Candidatus Omnitrophica bacterium]|nr:type IV pilin protein [Candidatus Omnitrophota bacterium]
MNRKGFTLVEVLIVVIIIGILAAIGIPQFSASIERAKGGEAKAGLGHIQTGEKVYFAQNEVYTTTTTDLDISLAPTYWSFTITTSGDTYTATASRIGSGSYAGQTITMTQAGVVQGNWKYR